MRDCFVTGATGHIGNVLVKKMLEKGYRVTVLCLPNEDLTPLEGLNVSIIYGDITDRDFVMKSIHEGQDVFHLAAAIDIDDGGKNAYDKVYKINVEGTKNIVDACIANKARRLIYTSSVHIIEPVKDVVLKEPKVFDDSKIFGNYSKTKTIATKYVIDKSREGLIDAVVVYPAGVIGPFDYKISEMGQVVLDYLNGKLAGYVKGGYNFIDVRDVCDAIINAGEIGKSGEGYILSGTECSIKEMIVCLNTVLKRKKLPPKYALWFLKMFAKLSNAYYKVRGKKPVFSEFSLYTLNANANFSNKKAVENLGLKTRKVIKSFKDAVDWFIVNKKDLINFNKIKDYKPNQNISLN